MTSRSPGEGTYSGTLPSKPQRRTSVPWGSHIAPESLRSPDSSSKIAGIGAERGGALCGTVHND